MRKSSQFLATLLILLFGSSLWAQYKSPWDVQPTGDDVVRKLAIANNIGHGVIVGSVPRNSVAERFGLRYGDLITRIGDALIADPRDFYDARDKNAKTKETVTITLWRSGKEMTLSGVMTNPFGPAVQDYDLQFDTFLALLDKGDTEAAARMVKADDSERVFKPRRDAFLARILMLPDTPPESSEELLRLLTALRPWPYYANEYIAIWRVLEDHGKYNAAANVVLPWLEKNPGDLSNSLNVGLTLANLKRNDEADALVKRFIGTARSTPLSAYGEYVCEWVLSLTEENRGHWESSYDHYFKGISVTTSRLTNDDVMRGMFLAAKLKDQLKFAAIKDRARLLNLSEVMPYADSLEAYFLAARGEQETAKGLVAKWKSTPADAAVLKHWTTEFPDVASTWKSLRQ